MLIHPADYEPFGLVLLEAVKAGTPVVASTRVGALEVMEGVPTFEPGSARDAAIALLRAMEDRDRFIRIQSRSPGLRRRWTDVARELLELAKRSEKLQATQTKG